VAFQLCVVAKQTTGEKPFFLPVSNPLSLRSGAVVWWETMMRLAKGEDFTQDTETEQKHHYFGGN